MEKNLRKNNAITLIALIITIIILLILAGVAIAALTGDNGLFSRTRYAKKNAEISAIEEQLKLGIYETTLDNYNNKLNIEDYMEIIKNNNTFQNIEEKEENGEKIVIINNKYKFKVKEENSEIKIEYVDDSKETTHDVILTYDKNYLKNNILNESYNFDNWSSYATDPSKREYIEDNTVLGGNILEFTMNAGAGGGVFLKNNQNLKAGQEYKWSVYIKTSSEKQLSVGNEQGGINKISTTTSWQKYTYTFTATDTIYTGFIFYVDGSLWTDGDKIYIHSLELEEGNGEQNETMVTSKSSSKLGTLENSTRDEYIFDGWYTEPTGGEKITSETITPSTNTKYYAHWIFNRFYLYKYGNEYIDITGGWNGYKSQENGRFQKNDNNMLLYYSTSGSSATDLQTNNAIDMDKYKKMVIKYKKDNICQNSEYTFLAIYINDKWITGIERKENGEYTDSIDISTEKEGIIKIANFDSYDYIYEIYLTE